MMAATSMILSLPACNPVIYHQIPFNRKSNLTIDPYHTDIFFRHFWVLWGVKEVREFRIMAVRDARTADQEREAMARKFSSHSFSAWIAVFAKPHGFAGMGLRVNLHFDP